MGPGQLEPKEIDGRLVSPGKVYTLLTDHLLNARVLVCPGKVVSSQTIHTYDPLLEKIHLKHCLDVIPSRLWVTSRHDYRCKML